MQEETYPGPKAADSTASPSQNGKQLEGQLQQVMKLGCVSKACATTETPHVSSLNTSTIELTCIAMTVEGAGGRETAAMCCVSCRFCPAFGLQGGTWSAGALVEGRRGSQYLTWCQNHTHRKFRANFSKGH